MSYAEIDIPMVVVFLSRSVSFNSTTPWTVALQAPLSMERVAISSSRGIFLTKGSNPHLLTSRWILYHRATWEAPDKPMDFAIP